MARNLKLVGLKTYTNAVTKSVIVKKGDICRFDESVADKVIEGARKNADDEAVPYWEETDEKATHDFASEVNDTANEDEGIKGEDSKSEDAPAPAAKPKQRVTRARA